MHHKKFFLIFTLIFICIFLICGCSKGKTVTSEYKNNSDNNIIITSSFPGSVLKGIAYDIAAVSPKADEASKEDMSVSAADASLLVCLDDNEVIYEKNIYSRIAPASLTKLMTALVVMENSDLSGNITLNNECHISYKDAQVVGFKSGDTVSLRSLFDSMIVFSGNDSANALASYIGGSVADFCNMMNEKARELYAYDSHFDNPNGLDSNDLYTTVYDLYLIYRACLKHDLFKEVSGYSKVIINYTDAEGKNVSKTLNSTDRYLVGKYSAPEGITVLGGKTGTTVNAKHCLILNVSDKNGKTFIAISMGNEKNEGVYEEMNKILSLIK